MTNTIRADFYRLLHSKGFWLMQALILYLLILNIHNESISSIAINGEVEPTKMMKLGDMVWTGANSFQTMGSELSLNCLFFIPLFYLIVGRDFSFGSFKVNLMTGTSRPYYIFSKFISLSLVLLGQVILYYAISFSGCTLLNGLGELTLPLFQRHLFMMITHYLLILGLFSIGFSVLFITQSNLFSLLTIILFYLFVPIISFFKVVPFISYLNFYERMDQACYSDTSLSFYFSNSLFALLFMAILIFIGVQVFSKKDF